MPDSPVPFPHPSGPLAGYRVLDLADEKGQLCARLLGELGADVIKVEAPREGDPVRQQGPFYKGDQGPETSLPWWTLNAGKRSVTAQLRLEAGRELVRGLAAKSDIVVETFPPGGAAELGLDYPSLSAANAGLIQVSITNWGQTGPLKDWLATDIVASAMGGHMGLNGDPCRGPVRTTAPQAYVQANVQAAVGAMIALYARGVHGVGQQVDVSMQEAMVLAMDNAMPTWDILHVNPSGPGSRRNNRGVPAGKYLYETRDGWIAAAAPVGPAGATLVQWLAEEGEAQGLDSPEWLGVIAGMVYTGEQRAYLESVMEAFCKPRGKEELVAGAQQRAMGWAPVFSPREVVESKQLAGRDYWVWVRHEDLGESFLYPGAPWKLSLTPWQQRGRAPHIGEHNEQVYGELLGLDEAELRRMRLKMVV